MLMIVMSVAISVLSIQSFYTLPQSGSSSSQTARSSRVQQEKKDATYPAVLNLLSVVKVEPVALAPGDNAWAVQIVSRGGLTGTGRGDLTLSSDGILFWNGADGSCNKKLTDETMKALTEVVLAADLSVSLSEGAPAGFCGDCYVTSMIVQHRGVAGVSRASRATWDDANQAKVPADIFTIYESLMAQRGCNLQ